MRTLCLDFPQASRVDRDQDMTPIDPARVYVLQDVMRGRRTEINELNGYVVAQGKALGVPTPFNEAIVREVSRYAVGTLTPDMKNLDPLAAMLPKS